MKKILILVSSIVSFFSNASTSKLNCIIIKQENQLKDEFEIYGEEISNTKNSDQEILNLISDIKNSIGSDATIECIKVDDIKKGTQDGEWGK